MEAPSMRLRNWAGLSATISLLGVLLMSVAAFGSQTVEILSDTVVFQNRAGQMVAAGKVKAGSTFAVGPGGEKGPWIAINGDGVVGWVTKNKVRVGDGAGANPLGAKTQASHGFGSSKVGRDKYFEFLLTPNSTLGVGLGGGFFYGFGQNRQVPHLELGLQFLAFPVHAFRAEYIRVGGGGPALRYRRTLMPQLEGVLSLGAWISYSDAAALTEAWINYFASLDGRLSYIYNDRYSFCLTISYATLASTLSMLVGVELHL